MYKILTPDFCHEDTRGALVQLVHEGYKQVNVVFSKGGTVRGGHYHRWNREAFYVIEGVCEVTLLERNSEETRVFSTGEFFLIEPNVGHIFHYLEDTILVGLYDKGVETDDGIDIIEI